MGTLAALLLGLTGPIVMRVLLSMGLGVISYTGATVAINAAVAASKAAWAGMAADVLALLTMAGVFESMSITVGGVMGGLAFLTFKRFGLLT